MKIYFTCSTAEFNRYKTIYFAIRDFLVSEGHTLTRDWLERTRRKIDSGDDDIKDIKEIYQANMRAIRDADLVIIEDTVSNFSTGHQITVALQKQKPTLVLWSEPKHRHFKQTFIQGVDSEYLQVAEYKQQEFKSIIAGFVKRYEHAKQRNRFHLVLSESEREYLDWAQYNRGESRTEVIRKLLRKEIESDGVYQTYLKSS